MDTNCPFSVIDDLGYGQVGCKSTSKFPCPIYDICNNSTVINDAIMDICSQVTATCRRVIDAGEEE